MALIVLTMSADAKVVSELSQLQNAQSWRGQCTPKEHTDDEGECGH